MDGNYHFNLKSKRTDKDDVPLTKGAAYFANEDDAQRFLGKAPRPTNEVSYINHLPADASR